MSETKKSKEIIRRKSLPWEWIVTSWAYALKKSMEHNGNAKEPVSVHQMTSQGHTTHFYGYWDHFFDKLEEIQKSKGLEPKYYMGANRDHLSIRNKVTTFLDNEAKSKAKWNDEEIKSFNIIKSVCKYKLVRSVYYKGSVTLNEDLPLRQALTGSGDIDWSKV
jgi:hypothetical protein|tara:strand:- start:1516 stop:2004 length:489 start_codon:yes stop_codon:yes gene_type:complete